MTIRKYITEIYTLDDLSDNYDEDIDNLDDFYYKGNEVDEQTLKNNIQVELKDAIQIFENKLNIFDSIHIRIVHGNNDDVLGMFVHESAIKLKPYITINYDAVELAIEEGYDIHTVIHTTLFHELGHAMVEVDNFFKFYPDKNIFAFSNEEEFVEDFAFNLFNFSRIAPEFKELEKQVKRIKTEDIDIDEDFLL